MKTIVRCVSAAILSVIFGTALVSAQATAGLNGTVRDDSGGVLPGVTVVATQTDTGFTRSVVTDGDGAYTMPNLPLGPYRIEASLQGFRTYSQTGVVLQVGANPTINVALEVGTLEETVSVVAAAPLVDVRSAGVTTVVEEERIVELPLQGRQVTDLIVLAGAAVQTGAANNRNFQGGVNISVGGGVSFGVAYTLDGAMYNDVQNSGSLPLPFPDALQEFSVATSGLVAQYGMHTGASVNAVTKSGTNILHGNAFEFLRDARFNATNPFAAIGPDGKRRDDGLKRNQFGGTVGGPLVRDRMFFFGAYQGTFERQTPVSNIAFVPTAAMIAGDFTAFASPACNAGRQLTLRGGFVNNRIDPALFSPAALQLVKRLPQTDNPCGETSFAAAADKDSGQSVGRFDYQLDTNVSMFARYLATTDDRPSSFSRSPENVLAITLPDIDNLAQALTIGETHVLGSGTINSLRFAYNTTRVDRSSEQWFAAGDLGSKFYTYPVTPGQMIVSVPGQLAIGVRTVAKLHAYNRTFQFGDDVTLVRGRHQVTLGGNIAYWTSVQQSWADTGGNWTFNGAVSGSGLGDLLLGRVAVLAQGYCYCIDTAQWYQGLYAQDAWRMTDRVTLNAGVRWEPFYGLGSKDGAITNFSRENFDKGVRSTQFTHAPTGFLYPGDPGFPGGQAGFEKRWWNISPRLGLAWDASGDGRTAVRSSYSLAYDFPPAEAWITLGSGSPFDAKTQLNSPPGGLDDPYGHVPAGSPHPAVIGEPEAVYVPFGQMSAIDPDINAPRVHQWNLFVEQQLGTNWGVSVGYMGSYSDRLWGQLQANPAVFMGLGPCTINGVSYPVCSTTTNTNQRRDLSLANLAEGQYVGSLDVVSDPGSQSYRGLKLAVQRRAVTGVSLNGNYTWSRCFGLEHDAGNDFGAGYTNPADPDFDRGHCDADRTHIANLTMGVQTPEFQNTALRVVASNWRISGILNARSGSWLNITTGVDTALNGQVATTGIRQRVDQLGDDVYGAKTVTQFLDRAAFALPAPGTYGTFERNSIRGPGFWKVDLALARLFPLNGRHNIEGRIEVFNLTNNFNWGNPQVNFSSATFGRITTIAGDMRIMQFGLKYSF